MYQPRWYHEEALDATFNFFVEHRGPGEHNPLVCMPTGTGKSLQIAEFDRRALAAYPTTRILNATHVKELIENNAKTAVRNWPAAPVGIYSAGLKTKEHDKQIVYGGIQSMADNAELFGWRDIIKVDEAHLISPSAEARYQKLILEMKKINPYCRVVGYTATPYRLGLGHMTNGNIFTDVAYDITDMSGFNRLIAEGYLCPVIPRRTNVTLDVGGVGMGQNGDFNEKQLQAKIDQFETTFECLREVVSAGQDRASWMIFAAGIEHAEHITEMLKNVFGVSAVCVHSKMSPIERDANIELFKSGLVRCIVNKDILTTGFDHPPLDLIAVLRPTMSTGLWVQMLGRGTRPYDFRTSNYEYRAAFYYVKRNCLVLDFAGNTKRLGPINDPVIPLPKGAGKPGDAPVKICECGVYNHSSARYCDGCGKEFPVLFNLEPKLDTTSSTDELIRGEAELPILEWFDVQRVIYDTYRSRRTGIESVKATYYCAGLKTFWEYKNFEPPAKPYAIHTAHDWFKQRYNAEPPATNADVIALSPYFRMPARVNVWVNKPKSTPEIKGYEF